MSSYNDGNFLKIVLERFRFQATNNAVYASYLNYLGKNPLNVQRFEDIPFLPIQFFKNQVIKTGTWQEELIFTSSGTTSSVTSRHFVRSMHDYLENARRCFEQFFGPLENFHFLAVLPSYSEREGSSLLAMIDFFMQESKSSASGYYLANYDKLLADAARLKSDTRKTIVWGVSFALLELAEMGGDLGHCIVIETGGMKGRRKEITRQELHQTLTKALQVDFVYSEYGMTELFSQAYTQGGQAFTPGSGMMVLGRSLTDPFELGLQNELAGINIIDLANTDSISFIETEDLGRILPSGEFEILGRLDNSDSRGCNLLIG